MKVAVVWNRSRKGVINRFGQPCPEKYGKKTVDLIIGAIREGGHEVELFEADRRLCSKLMVYMPPDENGQPTGIVFNLAYGIQGECRYTHLPAMLEMAGVPYTGSSPMGHALALDKVVTKILLQHAGVPTPKFRVLPETNQNTKGLRFPLIVKPRHESTSYGLKLVQNETELDEAVKYIVEQYQQEALVEEYIDGREFCVGILGNENAEILPIVETDFGNRELKLNTWDDKYHKSLAEPEKVCPAPINEDLAKRLQEISLATFRACHCKDYSRIDIRVDKDGNPFVLEINSMASLGSGGSYVYSAKVAGLNFNSLINKILEVTSERYFGQTADKAFAVTN
ncbi:MAG TPA: ATP-grasp domain-containing protein [Pyrinomonadaceae bacterium]|nr:ATP-grasp domain-containing protein [Pyrinomonadaceae bacterium]